MRAVRRFVGGIERQHLVLVSLVVLVALAGCAGTDGGDNNESPVGTTTPDGTQTPAENDSDDANDSDGADGPEFGTDLDSDVTPAEGLSVTTGDVVSDAIAADDATSEYRVSSTLNATVLQNNVERSQEIETVLAVDREEMRLRSDQRISVSGQTVSQTNYLVDGTFYQNSEVLTRQYNAEWIRQNVSENYTEQFRLQDELAFHSSLLENGTVQLDGAQQVDGDRAYRLSIESDGSGLADFFGFNATGDSNVTVTSVVWVDAETGELVRSEGRLKTTTEGEGQTVTTTITYVDSFEYTDVTVTLPAEADTAVEVDESGEAIN